jgi:hypothetical protein
MRRLAIKRFVAAKGRFFVSLPVFFPRNQSSQTGSFAAKRLWRGLWNKKITYHRLAFPFDPRAGTGAWRRLDVFRTGRAE